jgi:hypothetical protein
VVVSKRLADAAQTSLIALDPEASLFTIAKQTASAHDGKHPRIIRILLSPEDEAKTLATSLGQVLLGVDVDDDSDELESAELTLLVTVAEASFLRGYEGRGEHKLAAMRSVAGCSIDIHPYTATSVRYPI